MNSVTEYRKYTKETDRAGFAVVRVANHMVDLLGGRYSWVRITGKDGKTIYRTIRGAGDIDLKSHQIELDYDGSVDIGINGTPKINRENGLEDPSGFRECDLKLTRIGFFRKIIAHWMHPDPAYRAPMQLAIVLGGIGILIGILSLTLTVL